MKPKLKVGNIIEYFDPDRKGILHYGSIVEVRIRKDSVVYVTQDHHEVKEGNVKKCLNNNQVTDTVQSLMGRLWNFYTDPNSDSEKEFMDLVREHDCGGTGSSLSELFYKDFRRRTKGK